MQHMVPYVTYATIIRCGSLRTLEAVVKPTADGLHVYCMRLLSARLERVVSLAFVIPRASRDPARDPTQNRRRQWRQPKDVKMK